LPALLTEAKEGHALACAGKCAVPAAGG